MTLSLNQPDISIQPRLLTGRVSYEALPGGGHAIVPEPCELSAVVAVLPNNQYQQPHYHHQFLLVSVAVKLLADCTINVVYLK